MSESQQLPQLRKGKALAPEASLATPPPPPSSSAGPIVEFLSGSAAGAAQVLVGQPLDTVKTRAQTAMRGQFKGTWDIIVQTTRKEGPLAFYKGTLSPLVGISAVNSLLFAANGYFRRLISPYPELTTTQIAIAGAAAGAVNSVLASPVELFKVRMQGQYGGKADKKLWEVIRNQYQEWGFRNGIMRGFWATVAREIPAYASFYAAYDVVKTRLERFPSSGPFGPGSTLTYLTSGACGGIGYWLASYPLDVVKSRVQSRATPPQKGLGYIGAELSAVVAESGFSGLFRGIGPTLIRAVPAAAVTFYVFETTKTFLTSV